MMLIAIGENFKKIDKETEGEMLAENYPDIHWSGIKGVRDLLSHQYFNIDAEEIFYIYFFPNDFSSISSVLFAAVIAS